VRRLVREARQQGMSVLILIDPINPESLRGTSLQGTLLRARRSLKNLAMYEGAMLRLASASGRHARAAAARARRSGTRSDQGSTSARCGYESGTGTRARSTTSPTPTSRA